MEANLALTPQPDLSELIDDYLAAGAARNLSQESVKLYRISLTRFRDFCPVPVVDVDSRTLRRYIFAMQSEGLSSSTVQDYFGHVRSFFGYLASEGIVPGNPAQSVPIPRKAIKLPRVLSEAQAQALLDACPEFTWAGQRDKTAIFLLLGSGLRVGELIRLNLYDMDLDSGELNVMGKGSKERTVSIDRDVIAVLQTWLALRLRILNGRPQDAVFISRSYNRMGKNTFGQNLKRYAGAAGFVCTPHTCRHTYATDWIRSGGDLQRLKEQLGHSHISMTEKYVHLARKDFQEAANKYSMTKRLRFDSRQLQLTEAK